MSIGGETTGFLRITLDIGRVVQTTPETYRADEIAALRGTLATTLRHPRIEALQVEVDGGFAVIAVERIVLAEFVHLTVSRDGTGGRRNG